MVERDRQFLTSAPVAPGDTVALLSPASWSDADWVASSVATLEASGLQVALGEHASDELGYLAGRDEDRLTDLNTAIRDPRVRAIITLRGGCGSFRLVHGVDVTALRNDPKPLVGFSDITALHRVWHRAGIASLHGCVAGAHADDVLTQLMGAVPPPLRSDPGAMTAGLTTSGVAEGWLFGGNLEMLARSIGVLDLDLRDHVLLLEANRAAGLGLIDRALAQLIMSASLTGITGIAVGRMDGYEGFSDRGWTVLDVLHDHLDGLGVPILGGLPLGHGPDPHTVPLGVRCRLDADRGTLTASPAVADTSS